MKTPITALFNVFSIYFAYPMPAGSRGENYLLIAVEHFTGWPIAQATSRNTSDVVTDFVKNEIIYMLGHRKQFFRTMLGVYCPHSLKSYGEARD